MHEEVKLAFDAADIRLAYPHSALVLGDGLTAFPVEVSSRST